MNVLVVQAHPTSDSFNAAMMSAVIDGLTEAGHTYDTIKLYEEDFVAAMSAAERVAYKTEEPIVDPQVSHHVDLLRNAEALVFVYPTWFFGMPAVMKGWLDRVLVPGVAFVFDESGRVRPGLTNIRRLVGVSTYGSSWQATRLLTDAGRRTVTRTLRLVCSRRTRTKWLALYGIDDTTDAQRTRFLDTVRRRMANL